MDPGQGRDSKEAESGEKKVATESNPSPSNPSPSNPCQSPSNPSPSNPCQSPSGRLVYVRRRVEVETSKDKAKSSCLVSSSTAPPSTDWEERYHHLQMLLGKLSQSDHTDHVQMLWSLSSGELSKHAVDLEKRSIHLSLEEAREMQRVAALNVLGKSLNALKSTSNDGEQ